MSRPESPTLVFAVGGMHCASCGLLVDDFVEEVPGVASSTTHPAAGRSSPAHKAPTSIPPPLLRPSARRAITPAPGMSPPHPETHKEIQT